MAGSEQMNFTGLQVKVAQSCPTFCSPIDYTVHEILQARILEWVAFPFPGNLPNPGIEPRSPTLQADFFHQLSYKGSPRILEWWPSPSPWDLPDPGIKPGSPALQADCLPTELSGNTLKCTLRTPFLVLVVNCYSLKTEILF